MTRVLPQGKREWLIFAMGGLLVLFGAMVFEWWEDDPSQPWNEPGAQS